MKVAGTLQAGAVVAVLVATASAQAPSKGLKIVVLAGEDAVNVLRQNTATAPLVALRDGNDLPVAGALVTFAIQGGKSAAFAGGATTLTVTTNAAGQAAAIGLTPLTTGAVQINVQAVFQGQTVATAISQTNVLTAAQAATVGASGASGSGGAAGGSAAAGASGGLSPFAIGLIGAAAGGGALVATKLTGANPAVGTYSGSFNGVLALAYSETQTGVRCTLTNDYSGTLTLRLERLENGNVTGEARYTSDGRMTSNTCGFADPRRHDINFDAIRITGTESAVTFREQFGRTAVVGSETFVDSNVLSFSGALSNGIVAGSVVLTEETNSLLRRYVGSVTFPVTLR